MKIIQSFWSKPYLKNIETNGIDGGQKANFLTKNLFLASRALSMLNLQRHFDEVVLITDDYGKRLLVDYLNLPYTAVSTALNDLQDYDPDLQAVEKIYTYSIQKEPFIHVDGDVFFWGTPDEDIMNAPLICQHKKSIEERLLHGIENVCSNLDHIPSEMLAYQDHMDALKMLDSGIFGGSDLDFIKRFTTKAFELIDKNDHHSLDINIKHFNTVFLQYLCSCMVHKENRKLSDWSDYNISENFTELTNYFTLPDKVSYTHLIAFYKKQIINMEQIVLNLMHEYPDYYNYFLTLFGEEIYDANLKIAIPKS